MAFSNDMIEKAKTASSAEELMRMAAEEGIELTAEEAGEYFTFLNYEGPLSDEALESVAGGKGSSGPKYSAGQKVQFKDSDGICHYGKIDSSWWVESKRDWYYWVLMEDGRKMGFQLETHFGSAKVIS